jgi:hypothetical protein
MLPASILEETFVLKCADCIQDDQHMVDDSVADNKPDFEQIKRTEGGSASKKR